MEVRVNPVPTPETGAATEQSPAALLYGPGLIVVHGNAPFRAEFGAGCLRMPALEALPDLPAAAFDVIKLVFERGTPLASWIVVRGTSRRLTVAARRDIETGEIYGVAVHLVARERPGKAPAGSSAGSS